MNKSSEVLHLVNRDKNRHWHLLMLLIPSIVFVVILSLFLRNRGNQSTSTGQVSIQETPDVKPTVQINNVTIPVRLARTQAEQQQGLSGVESMPQDEGMLFIFPSKTRTAFWMKDMYINLDIIWIAEGKIIQIDKNAKYPEPNTLDSNLKLYLPNQTIDHVLEVNAGFSDAHNIKVGDSISLTNL